VALGFQPAAGFSPRGSAPNLKYTTASGGTVTRMECGWPCQGSGSDGNPPRFPMLLPPKQAASLLRISR